MRGGEPAELFRTACLHHSNSGAAPGARPGAQTRQWGGESASAEAFVECCRSAGLSCPVQEVVDWGGVDACDAFSVVTRPGSRWDRDPIRLSNPFFMGEAQSLAVRSALYGGPGEGEVDGEPGGRGPGAGSGGGAG